MNQSAQPEKPFLKPDDTLILKGMAMTWIVLHNYFHWLPGLGIENEFFFNEANFLDYIDGLLKGVKSALMYSFAYFGHFGVQIFILLSGYGLHAERKNKKGFNYPVYFLGKARKLAILLLIGMIFAFLVRYISTGEWVSAASFLQHLALRMTSIANFQKQTVFDVAGPFWFFGLMIQLYLIFPAIYWAMKRTSPVFDTCIIMALSIINALLYPWLHAYDVPMMALFVGQMPVFIFGMALSKHGFKTNRHLLISSVILFILGQRHEVFFTSTFIALSYILVHSYALTRDCFKKHLPAFNLAFGYIGSISMAIFIINGPLRTLPLFKDSQGEKLDPGMFLAFTAILLILSVPIAHVYTHLNKLAAKKA